MQFKRYHSGYLKSMHGRGKYLENFLGRCFANTVCRNIYGDEIYEYGYDRSLWGCQKCGKVKSLPDLHL